MLAVRAPGVFFCKRRDRHHAAVLRLATQPAEKSTYEQTSVEPIRLRSPMLSRHRDAGRMDHIDLDPPSLQPPRQPEPVAAGFEGRDDPLDLAAGFDRLVPPSMQQCQKRFRIGTLLLQWRSFEAGNNTPDQPGLETQFNHRNQRAILIKGDEGSAQIVPFHGALHRLSSQQRWCHTLVACPIASLPSRERASQCFSEDEGVRGRLRENLCAEAPSPIRISCDTIEPSPSRSRIYPTSANLKCRTRVNPSSGGRGHFRRQRTRGANEQRTNPLLKNLVEPPLDTGDFLLDIVVIDRDDFQALEIGRALRRRDVDAR